MLRAWRTLAPFDPALSGQAAVRSGIQCGDLACPFLPSGVCTTAQKSGCSAHHVIGEYKSNGSWSRTSAFCEKVHFVRRATVLTAVGKRASFAPLRDAMSARCGRAESLSNLSRGICLRPSRLFPNIAAGDVNGRGTALNALTTSRGYRRIDVIGGGHVTVHIF